ncbi:MAG: hypothetical protein A3A80_02300 [Candidatus Terrybacteria bacterium RIFCSPLOWO2_01_FULL_44_24]|uniref:Uncharacterized protein n=1 Tax=Candidatus Terrybacteria bacterium RIFCSPHIGHO2_01_FULL_43_35 TaxID=1802361 RepID=A0A1G2PGF5_9BACT|nr:MAG: hypothetical protein A2828_02090 [Candidatus Terrybacteria bacterium RIFCSPHIGHO2_01_FULL_43_35]OHA50910.1 MAG: hypothetical protein A3A80_02300 [Candidatus Terrybacteria bacterium RIFCSPLOWO2_01_FULL_44_24]
MVKFILKNVRIRSQFALLMLGLIVFFSVFYFAQTSNAATICTINDPNQGIPFEKGLGLPIIGSFNPTIGTNTGSLPDLIVYVFKLGVGSAGFLALVMMVVAGIQYAAGAGNSTSQNEAKERITNAILGLVLLLSSYIILAAINGSLVNFATITLPTADNAYGAKCPSQRSECGKLMDNVSVDEANSVCNANTCGGIRTECAIERSYTTNSTTGYVEAFHDVYCCAPQGTSSGGGGAITPTCSISSCTACTNQGKAACEAVGCVWEGGAQGLVLPFCRQP